VIACKPCKLPVLDSVDVMKLIAHFPQVEAALRNVVAARQATHLPE